MDGLNEMSDTITVILRKELIYHNGLKSSDIERITLLIDCQLLLIRVKLDQYNVRDIIHSVYNTIKKEVERSIRKNRD